LSSKGSKDTLERLGVDMTSRDMQVLKALTEVASRSSEGVTYTDISSHLKEKGIKLSKVWIYKCLSRLEDEGFVVTERISNPRSYTTSQRIIADALEKKRKAKVDELKSEKEEVSAELESVKNTSVEDLTMMVYNTIVGSVPIDSSTVIEGVENVRSILIKEFFQKAKKGDILRVIAPTQVIDRGGQTSGITEMELLQKAAEGIELRTILVPTEDASRDPGLIAAYIGDLKDILMEALQGGSLKIKSPGAPLKTYRMVSLNNDVMLLYLAHAPASDMAALVRREDNPGLLDDAFRLERVKNMSSQTA
jgi:Fe2+ or Zn2+ uptake regulation protein